MPDLTEKEGRGENMAPTLRRLVAVLLPGVVGLAIGFYVGKWQGFNMGLTALETETRALLSLHVEAASCVHVGDSERALRILDTMIDGAVLSLTSQPFAPSTESSLSKAKLYRTLVPPSGPAAPEIRTALEPIAVLKPSPHDSSGLARLAMSAGAAQALDEGAAMARAEQRALSSLRERLPPLTCDASLHGFSGPYVAGKYSLLLFWAPWCGPCKPVMDELASLDPEGDIAVLTASQFRPEDAQRPDEEYGLSAVRMLLAQHNLEKPTCAYTNKAQRLAWAGGIPRLILFGRSGSVEAVAIGGDRCEALIGKLRAGWRP